MINNNISNKMMKAAMAALLAGVPFIQSVPVLAKEKDPEPEAEDYDFYEEFNEDDWGTEFTYEDEYDWLNGYETLTDKEKEKVKEVLDLIYDLYDEMAECYDDEGYKQCFIPLITNGVFYPFCKCHKIYLFHILNLIL